MKQTVTFFLLSLLLCHSMMVNAQNVKTSDDTPKTPGESILLKAKKANKKDADPANAEFDPSALEKRFAKDPGFSNESANQKEIDKELSANQAIFDSKTEVHVNELYECQKLSTSELIKKCREEKIKKKSKAN